MMKGCIVAAAAVLAAGCISKEKSEATCHDDFRLRRYIADYEGFERKKELEKQGLYIGPHESYLVCSPQKKQQGDFAMELYRQMANNKDNLAFSPYGVASVCALVGAGAKGETAEAFKNILGLSTDNSDEIARIFGGLKQRLAGSVKVSDSIWLFRGVKPRDEFCRKTAAAFHAESRSTTGGAAAMREINAYIERNTSGKIPQLLRCPPSPYTRMMAVNTLYLKAKWEQPFQAAWTKIRDFKTQTGKTVEVPFMDGQIFCAGYYKTKGLSVLTLPYRDCGLEMVFLLPDEDISISRIEALLSESFLWEIDRSILHKGDPYDSSVFEGVYVTIPKFEMAMRHDITQSLCWMGIGIAFNPNRADFSGIASEPIHLSEVVQSVRIRVDEEGTEAAAATEACGVGSEMPSFVADHPFIFLLRDRTSRTILFMGRVTNPAEKS